MKLSDVFAVPLSKVRGTFTIWVVACVLTMVPGTLLCLVTLGGFRYFNIMNKFCDYLVQKDLDKNGYY